MAARKGIQEVMLEQGHAENLGRISDRRSYPRQEMKALCYVDLSDMNGGILVNLSEGGLALQAVTDLMEDQPSRMRFQLSGSANLLETGGRIKWISPSRRLAWHRVREFVRHGPQADQEIDSLRGLPRIARGGTRGSCREDRGLASDRQFPTHAGTGL